MCAVKGQQVLHEEAEDGELSPRSISSMTSTSSGHGSTSLHWELEVVEASDNFSYPDGALWQRTIPKGQRCKPLSFSGMILYDESGKQVELTFEPEDAEDADEEYFSPLPRNLAEGEGGFQSPHAVE